MRKSALERQLDAIEARKWLLKTVQRPRVRNRKRGRSYRPAVLGGISERQKAPTTPRRTPRPRDTGIADAWVRWQRRVPGIAGPLGGHTGIVDSAEVIFGALQQRTAERYWARRELGRNFPADPGPRGRPKPKAGSSGAPPRTPPGAVAQPDVARGDVRRPKAPAASVPTAIPAPADAPRPRPQPEVVKSGQPRPSPLPSGVPLPSPSTAKRPAAIPYPSQQPKTSARASFLLGESPLAMPNAGPQPRRLRERQVSRSDARARAQGAPLTRFNSLGVPSIPTNDDCKCSTTKRKPRKPSCTNPIISREQHGDILTIKRRIKCPPSKSK